MGEQERKSLHPRILITMDISNNRIFYHYIIKRIQNNKNFLAVAVGATGSGKSYGVLRMAELLDDSFSIDRIAFTPDDFMTLIKDKGLCKGSVVVYDEAGVGMDSRSWQSVSNKMINYVLQTFRYRNLIVFFTVPDLGFIDKQARKLVHATIETMTIVKRPTPYLMMKPKLVINNPMSVDEPYKVFLRSSKNGDGSGAVSYIKLKKPNYHLLKSYESKKEAFTDGLYGKAGNKIKDDEMLELADVTPTQRKRYKLYREGKKYKDIAEIEGVTYMAVATSVNRVKQLIFQTKKRLADTSDL